jgi:crossover junction endodeoxyribonuclease RuvC
MIVIGIDPGIEKTGIGIVELNNTKLNLIHKELIYTSSKEKTEVRLEKIYNRLSEILNNFKIDNASVEKLFFSKNVKTAITVAEVRGIIILALQQKKIPIYEYTPLQIKQGLIGYGRGTKKQIQELIKIILKSDEIEKQDDIADGIALAIVHLNSYKTLSKIKDYS